MQVATLQAIKQLWARLVAKVAAPALVVVGTGSGWVARICWTTVSRHSTEVQWPPVMSWDRVKINVVPPGQEVLYSTETARTGEGIRCT